MKGQPGTCLEIFRGELRLMKTLCCSAEVAPSFLRPKFRMIVGPGYADGARRFPIGLYLL